MVCHKEGGPVPLRLLAPAHARGKALTAEAMLDRTEPDILRRTIWELSCKRSVVHVKSLGQTGDREGILTCGSKPHYR